MTTRRALGVLLLLLVGSCGAWVGAQQWWAARAAAGVPAALAALARGAADTARLAPGTAVRWTAPAGTPRPTPAQVAAPCRTLSDDTEMSDASLWGALGPGVYLAYVQCRGGERYHVEVRPAGRHLVVDVQPAES